MRKAGRRLGAVIVAAGLLVSVAGSGVASAHPGTANIWLRFHLVSHEVTVGDTVSGPVHLATRSDHHWVPLAGATLSVRVDGVDTGATVVTDDSGNATVQYTTDTTGDHVIKVVYAGDDTHRRRVRAQGFTVDAAA